MPQKIEKELKRVENLEKRIEASLKNIENQSSYTMALIYGIILGIISNIAAAIIYETQMRSLSSITQTIIGITILIIVPILIALIINEFKKIKKSKEILHINLGAVKEHKEKIIGK